MINLGNICLLLTLLSCIAGIVTGSRKSNHVRAHSMFQFALVTISLLKLINIHINTDYKFQNVVENSHELMPLLYKITGVWANHEGSMLLLLWSFSIVTFVFSNLSSFSKETTNQILGIQSAILFLILSIILTTSNPFLASETILPSGRGFNPLLQDVGLAIHPPILYLGYAGLSIPFSIMVQHIYTTKISINKKTIIYSYNWIFAPWALLCAGIGLGSWWAYRELGWGGFWFWDPVENIPLMVWFASTIALHSAQIASNKDNYTSFVTANISAFILSIFGMFLVRSGILTSVHSFASDPQRGRVIFIVFCIITIPSIYLLAKRYKYLQRTIKSGIKTSAILSNNLLLTIACIVILAGILYPVFQSSIFHREVSVEEDFYKRTLSFISIPMLYISGIYSCKNKTKFTINILLSLAALVIINILSSIGSIKANLHIHAATFLILSLLNTNKKNYVMALGHMGFAVIIIGGSLYYSYHTNDVIALKTGETKTISDKVITLKQIKYTKKENYLSREAVLEIKKNGSEKGMLRPEIRFYPIEKSFTIESAVWSTITGDIYVTLGELEKGKIVVEIQFKPFIYLIWAGVILTVFSFFLHLITRHAQIKISSKT